MCNDKIGLGKPKEEKVGESTSAFFHCVFQLSRVCQRCLGCKACSATMSPADKYSVKLGDDQIENFKQMFSMFDKESEKL